MVLQLTSPGIAGLRAFCLVPIVIVIGAYEYTHAFGGQMPIPFLAMFASIIVAAVAGGRWFGVIAASLTSVEIVRCYFLGIGPPALTGTLPNVVLGTLLSFGAGYWLGALRDDLDCTLAELDRHRAGLEADLQDERREKERSLTERAKKEARLRTAFRLASLGHFEFDTATGDCVYCSRRHAEHLGMTPEEFVAATAGLDPELCYVHPDDRDRVRRTIRRIRHGEPAELEYRALWPDGSIRHLREIVEPELDASGQVVAEIGTSMDLTDLRLAEAQLRESQKLEAVGRLTAGVAHDFNNLLAVIMGNLELLKEGATPKDEAEMIDAALGATARGAVLTGKLLSFGRKSMLSPEPLDLCMTVRELGTLFRRTLPTSIEIDLPHCAGRCMALVDRAQFESAMLNLVVNARDAMPSGGLLRIDGSRHRFDAAALRRAGLDLEPGDYVGIAVTDTGSGMSDEVRNRALEPFYSTKGVGKGSGLGLPMVLGFAKQSGGDVGIASAPGMGTTVTLYFKAGVAIPEEIREEPEDTLDRQGDGALVLLVEDDPSVRKITARQIQSLGYRVIQADTAQSALNLLEDHSDISLVLSDVVMPGEMQGTDLVQHARRMRPGLNCVLMSGYHQIPAADDRAPPPSVARLTKPISRADLGASLSAALDA